jgi:hypothetical protein
VSGSHLRSTGVGLSGSVHRAPSGKVRWSLDWVSYHMGLFEHNLRSNDGNIPLKDDLVIEAVPQKVAKPIQLLISCICSSLRMTVS